MKDISERVIDFISQRERLRAEEDIIGEPKKVKEALSQYQRLADQLLVSDLPEEFLTRVADRGMAPLPGSFCRETGWARRVPQSPLFFLFSESLLKHRCHQVIHGSMIIPEKDGWPCAQLLVQFLRCQDKASAL